MCIHFSTTPCEGIVEISPFVLINLPALVELGGSFPPSLEIRNSLHMHPNLELYSTQLDLLRFSPVSYQEGEEGEGGCRRCKVVSFFPGQDPLMETLPLCRMSLSATCNLKDCSIDAL